MDKFERLRDAIMEITGVEREYADKLAGYVLGFSLLDSVIRPMVKLFVVRSAREIHGFVSEGKVPDWIIEEAEILRKALEDGGGQGGGEVMN